MAAGHRENAESHLGFPQWKKNFVEHGAPGSGGPRWDGPAPERRETSDRFVRFGNRALRAAPVAVLEPQSEREDGIRLRATFPIVEGI